MAQDGKALHIQHGELVRLVERERVAGEGGDAQPGEDGLLDGLVAAQFQPGAKVVSIGFRFSRITQVALI
ncbi:MAG: hypothetical protein Q8L92_06015 [Rubrivivax sp.]|nr:hypothetical protein [Rubrivivax sp.]